MSSWLATQVSESPSGRRQRVHRNTSGFSAAATFSSGLFGGVPKASTLDMLAHFCSHRWRLESSDSRFPSSEDSLHLPWWLQEQAVEERPREKEPAMTDESAAPRSFKGNSTAAHAQGARGGALPKVGEA